MIERMTAQEAIAYLQNYPRDELHFPTFWRVMDMSIAALQASIPHVLILDEAIILEPHTAIWAEYNPSGIVSEPYEIGVKIPTYGWWKKEYNHSVRWWSVWPSPELRKETPWEEDAK